MNKERVFRHAPKTLNIDMSAEKAAFYEQYKQAAIEQQIKYGIPASLTLAQMAIESGLGTSTLSAQYNNYFGIKKGSSWTGPVVSMFDDHSYKEPFRVYNNVNESIEDHSRLLMKPIYQKYCRNYSSTDHVGWVYGISSVYASKGDYAKMLLTDINAYGLAKIDQEAVQQAQQRGVQIGYMRGSKASSMVSSTQQPKIMLAPLQGNWALPIDFSNVRVSGVYGESRPGHYHGGIDISTKGKYLPVVATEDNGKVVKVGNQQKGAGNYVTIQYDRQDGSKFQTTYMHLSSIGVKEGDTVNAGQQIAISGNTGRSTGAHLHFETKFLNQNEEWQKFDPVQYLAEIEVRSNQSVSLDQNGKDILANARSIMAVGDSQQNIPNQQDPNMSLLANITQSNDPTKWLAYLMNQNGENANGQDMFSEIISTMFKAAMALAVKIQADEASDRLLADASQQQINGQSQEDSTLVKRERETVDVKALQQRASVNFDTECPEQQQQQGQRLA